MNESNMSRCWLLADAIQSFLLSDSPDSESLILARAKQLVQHFVSIPDEVCVGSLRLAIQAVREEVVLSDQAGVPKMTARLGMELSRAVQIILSWPSLFEATPDVKTIKQLDREGVPHEQIARMYGIIHPVSRAGLAGRIAELLESGEWQSVPHPKVAENARKRKVVLQWLESFPTPMTGEHDYDLLRELSMVDAPSDDGRDRQELRSCYDAGVGVAEAVELTGMGVAAVEAAYREWQQGGVTTQEDDIPALRNRLKALGGVAKGNVGADLLRKMIEELEAKSAGGVGG